MIRHSINLKRARTLAAAVVWQPSALYQGMAVRRTVCLSPVPGGFVGGVRLQGRSTRTEGALRPDSNQLQE